MFSTSAITLLLAASAALGKPTPIPPRKCGTSMSPANISRAEIHFAVNKAVSTERIANNVNVYWHVISKDSTAAGGNVPDVQISNQIKQMNTDYAGNINWVLVNTSRTVNVDWFNNAGPSSTQETAIKNALRIGGKADLNVYSVGFTSGSGAGLLGYSTFPISYSPTSKEDGIVILFSSVPGGSTNGYNLGRTLTHESGHWLGLYHTFQGGCAGSGSTATTAGDFVADTPAEAGPASGCPSPVPDTCTGTAFPGADPIHNFMDYTQDSCMTGFTPGQFARMTTQFATYRT
ncbi:metalloprotease [Mycena alexandri]|uniref:Metalloprotease n=1 Tax=Mycena alexandri TaxID=1745969 RepID=A0AAD6SJV4_9AGAR|nr:metalloprotease [Mycena alexandri]